MPFAHLVKSGVKVHLNDIATNDTGGFEKDEAQERTFELGRELARLQELLFASSLHSLLIVLQGRDTSGKDGTIRRILDYSNVQSTQVVAFKQPSEQERAHDFLWRVHPHAPAKGGVTIFNRSHYEDVIVVRVHDLVPKKVWKKRFEQINAFEDTLATSGTIVLKFFLHISREEQRERLLDREKDPDKAWKLSVGDWEERRLWDAYTEAFEDALSKCSTDTAPWRVISADHKWFRDLAVMQALVDELRPFEQQWKAHLEAIGQERLAELAKVKRK